MAEEKNISSNVTIGIISDSHDNMDNIKKAVKVFNEKKTDIVFHLGDFVNPAAILAFQGLKIKAVFGNNDGDKLRLINAFSDIRGEIFGEFGEVELGGLKFALYHGANQEIKDALVKCGKYDVVFSGHTHILENKKIGNTLSINPGTAHGFGSRATIALFNTIDKKLEVIDL